MSEYQFEIVYRNGTPEVQTEIRKLWLENKAIVNASIADQRLKEVVVVLRKENVIIGVSTAGKIRVPDYNNQLFYNFRCFISPHHRLAGLDVGLSVATFSFLEKLAATDPEPCIGIFAILENKILQKEKVWRRAVWPEINMTFAGYTSAGDPIRVKYFKGARI